MSGAIANRRRQLRFSTKAKETAYGTVQNRDALLLYNKESMGEPDDTVENDADLLGPTLEPNTQEVVATSEMFNLNRRFCTLHEALFLIAYGLGKVTTTAGGTNAAPGTGAYKHEILMSDEDDLPTFTASETIYSDIGETETEITSGCGVSSFSLSANRGADRRVEVSASILGRGAPSADGSGDTSAAVARDVGGNPLDGAYSSVYLGTGVENTIADVLDRSATDLTAVADSKVFSAANAENLDKQVMSVVWSFGNAVNKDDNYRMGAGKLMSAMERGENPTQDITLTLEDKRGIASHSLGHWVKEYYRTQKALSLQWMLTDGAVVGTETVPDPDVDYYFGLNLIWPHVQIESWKPSSQGAKRTMDVVFKPLPKTVQTSVKVYAYNKWSAYAA